MRSFNKGRFIPPVLLVMGVTISTGAATQQAAGASVSGEGITACGDYLASRRTVNETQDYVYATWLRGFTSGFNFATRGKQITSVSAPATLLAYMDKYCRDNPLSTVAGGAFSLARELGSK